MSSLGAIPRNKQQATSRKQNLLCCLMLVADVAHLTKV